ncbi:hypothetical protein CONLIGDRAFT_327105 [Coniochaeta ligniaria NRRL 30616]|uniref:Fungal specific transcription factor n=1 Tax=Coniochaeta ligniaria NRRL 30616 TaxID=1408157 RepID=A0A1J7IQH5_9PEZI|nr:hypothetical protein CONLIGDRAFT_327105 [Coniochaeta ligniaria NRRL 30616]
MPGLADSRWAPKYNHAITYTKSTRSSNYGSSTTTETTTKSTTTATTPQPAPARLPASYNELTRYTKIVRRLKWKLPYLASGYRQAVDRVGPHADHQSRAQEAELMFKIDFFEYYMLIERALVHLLGVFGISVSPSFSRHHYKSETGTGTPDAGYYHRYHANVLEALDSPENPLHEVLGVGEVRRQLWRAKDLRNRWKNVDDPAAAGGEGRNGNYKGAAVESAPLESYDLEHILVIIFEGFDRAFIVAEQYVLEEMQRGRAVEGGDGENGAVDVMDGFEMAATEEEQWEFMVEAMDWEAV